MSPERIDHVIGHNISRADGRQFKHRYMRFGVRPPRQRFNWRRFLTWAIVILLALFLAGSIAAVGLIAWVAKDLPDPNNITNRALAQTTKIYDRTGETLLYEIHGDQKRTIVELDQISKYAIDATLAAEDKDFYKHHGFSFKGFLRAAYVNLVRGGRGQGGSTITQQFIKNSVLSPEKTYTRKLKELVLSLEMERRFTKDQILKLYLNEIPYGSVLYGIEAAAQSFFGKSAKDLTISEAAMLASLPKSTTYYSPFGSHTDELMIRTRYVIDVMQEQGMITAADAELAKQDDVLKRVLPKLEAIKAPHFVFHVREQLADLYGEATVERGGLKVITTLDWEKQQLAETAVTENLENVQKWGGSTAALLAIDPKAGEVLAMVGSPDYYDDEVDGKFNYIFGKTQPGSSIKPFVYALGFEKGYTPDTVLYDVGTDFAKPPAEPYRPADYDGQERGPVTVREALAGSLNIPAVKMLYLAGLNDFLDLATQKLGFTTFRDRSRLGLSLVLGGAEVRPFEHISAFVVFPREGLYRPPKSILKVTDNSGQTLLDDTVPTPEKRVYSEETTRQVSSILSDNAARAYIFGESNYLTLGERPVAAKTGTTQEFKDAWTVGYVPSLVTGVWVGNPKGGKMKEKADGSKIAAPIWNQFMRAALEGTPIEQFIAPQPIVTGKPVLDGKKNAQIAVKVDKVTGKLATPSTPPELVEERGFGVPHDILFFCDRKDPRGPAPADPAADSQFELWETGVVEWAKKQNLTFAEPPTETDDVHVPENVPTIQIVNPAEGGTLSERTVNVTVNASARRGVAKVEYLLDGEKIGAIGYWPFGGVITIPNRFGKGFHTLTAKAYDDVLNSALASVTVNLTAEPGPIGVQWSAPAWTTQTIYRSQFPYAVSFTLEDPKSIRELRLYAVAENRSEELIGVINDPPLPGITMNWNLPAGSGRYDLELRATLAGGDVRKTSLTVYVW